jgi:serine/threonine protein kinase
MDSVVVAASGKDMENIWPRQIEDDYERIKPIGEGGFGIVWLAKARNREDEKVDDDGDDSVDTFEGEDSFGPKPIGSGRGDSPAFVAIKQIAALKEKARQYAAREVAILSEVNHPNIVRCLRYVEMPRSQLVVMTLADGPTLGDLVTLGGALSLSLVRLAARQLISAVAYLHGRGELDQDVSCMLLFKFIGDANERYDLFHNTLHPCNTGVIHRDIKPDNCILVAKKVTTSTHHDHSTKDDWMSNDAFWDDKAVFDETEWMIILVDFGFAKALTPDECGIQNSSERLSVRTLVHRGIEKQASELIERKDDSIHDAVKNSRRNSIILKSKHSFERKPIRAMSALGTRDYAAPEVTKSRQKSDGDTALTEYVADYGLISDAYSIGCTIRVMLTGVPAKEKNEVAFMSSQGGGLLAILFSCCSMGREKRKRRYKWLDETPKPARELVLKLMNPLYADRLSVPLAREELWIRGGVNADDPVVTLPTGDIPAGIDDPIVFLKCAT